MNLTQLIDAYCLHRQQNDTAERSAVNKFRMSDAGKCRLMRYWKRQGMPFKPLQSADSVRAMRVGIILHDWLQESLEQIYFEAATFEEELSDEHRIGHYDALLSDDGKTILYDFKTIKNKEAYYLDNHGENTAKRQHQFQIVTYASMLDPRPDELRVAYIERESLRVVKECVVNYDQMIPSVSADWQALIQDWEAQKEPNTITEDTWECKYCNYNASCAVARR